MLACRAFRAKCFTILAFLFVAVMILTDAYADGSPNRYGPAKGYLECALLAYGDATELKASRQL